MHHASPRFRRFPFDPARIPFFYGWIVLGAGTLGMVMSAPGQTIGVSVFTDYLLADLSITRSTLSLTYLFGTLASAATLAVAGRLYDRFGARLVATISTAVLAATLVAFTFLPVIVERVFSGGAIAAFVCLAIAFWLLRLSGQGMLTLASRNMVMAWFDKRRGMANAVMGISISFGFSAAPRAFEALIGPDGAWQVAWRTIAIAAAGFGLFSLVVFRDRPEDHGLKPDGPLRDRPMKTHPETDAGAAFTLKQARATYPFWVFASSLFLAGLVITAYTFHIVSIFESGGMSRAQAVRVFLPAAAVAVVVEFVGSWVSDYIKIKYLAIVQLAGCAILSVSLARIGPGAAYVGVILGHGMMQGMFGVLSNVTWPRFFGRAHLGAIAGFATACTVVGTSVGPAFFSLVMDATGRYSLAGYIVGALALVVAVGAFRADRPAPPA
jgi:sugar phosphate permease